MPLPTSINNKMKLMTNIIYQVYGENDKMKMDQFRKWIEIHPKFIDSLQEWFRTNIWKMEEDPKTGEFKPGFWQLKPDFESLELVQNYNSFNKTKAYVKIYDVFLFIFKKEIKMVPDKICVLKGLNITYNDKKRKIYLSF